MTKPSPAEIRSLRAEEPKLFARDFALKHGITEACLIAANVGLGNRRLRMEFEPMFSRIESFGEVLALTRNEWAVHERTGTYQNFRFGPNASMYLGEDIDMRLFPTYFHAAYATEHAGRDGATMRSIQFFDAAGEAIHKIFLRDASDRDAFEAFVQDFLHPEQSQEFAAQAPLPVESAKADAERVDELRAAWDAMTDTHQFLTMVSRQKANRLGAYRVVGPNYVRALPLDTVSRLLHQAAGGKVRIMVFVGNRATIQIHSGLVDTIKPMGPWINVLDPRFNLHLREDAVAEVWAVRKPTKRGDVWSIEAFAADGGLIAQFFGVRDENGNPEWDALVASQPDLLDAVVA